MSKMTLEKIGTSVVKLETTVEKLGTNMVKLETTVEKLGTNMVKLETTVEKLAYLTQEGFLEVNKKFNAVDKRFEDFESRVNTRFNDFESKFNVRFNSIDARLDHHAGHYVTYPEHFRLAKRVTKLEKNKA